jgi:adenylate kinase family enzyme
MKVLVSGNSGSGKSTYARALAAQHGLTHLDLDAIVWEPGKIAVPRKPQAVLASLVVFISTRQKWVIEGCYGELVGAASTYCTQLVFLNQRRAARMLFMRAYRLLNVKLRSLILPRIRQASAFMMTLAM